VSTLIALLRAVNVPGGRKIGMAELRQVCEAGGFSDVRSYIASGNLVLRGKVAGAERVLEALIGQRFGAAVPVMVRTSGRWATYLAANPLAKAAAEAPSRLVLAVSKQPAAEGAVEALAARATEGEVIARCGDALVLHYPQGIGRSKLSPALVDRLVGSPTTARNWNTVLALAELAGA
jgi:uncharacterized protein (DUF1697 family)